MFRDRKEAAKELAKELKKYKDEGMVVMAIPRGGVPIGFEIANDLDCPLDIALTKKIGHPTNKEYAIGSVSLTGIVLNHDLKTIPRDYIETEVARIREQLQLNYHKYAGDRDPITVTGKTVVIVDDGVATGSTMLATIDLIRKDKPKKIVVAVPVAPPEAIRKLGDMVEEVICLDTPPNFQAVGQFYEYFNQVDDQEVIENLHGRRYQET